MEKLKLFGVRIARINRTEMLHELLQYATGDSRKTACYVNAHCLNLACVDEEYRRILSGFDLVYAGGQALVWASRMWSTPLPQRVNIMDYFTPLAEELKTRRISVYLLGADSQTVERAARRLTQIGINIVGWHHGYFTRHDDDPVIADINAADPALLVVGMGPPYQEKWIFRNRNRLNAKLCWALGGFLEYAAGNRKSAPAWLVNLCLEWLYLGLQKPSRLLKRYLFGNVLFVFRIFYYRLSMIGRCNEA
jgi:N-acetylglucosaminyldiphosphoundecaprenol N-acetyl-beta-D-mannosaminyltransferase